MGNAHELLSEMRAAAFDQYAVLRGCGRDFGVAPTGGVDLTAEP